MCTSLELWHKYHQEFPGTRLPIFLAVLVSIPVDLAWKPASQQRLAVVCLPWARAADRSAMQLVSIGKKGSLLGAAMLASYAAVDSGHLVRIAHWAPRQRQPADRTVFFASGRVFADLTALVCAWRLDVVSNALRGTFVPRGA